MRQQQFLSLSLFISSFADQTWPSYIVGANHHHKRASLKLSLTVQQYQSVQRHRRIGSTFFFFFFFIILNWCFLPLSTVSVTNRNRDNHKCQCSAPPPSHVWITYSDTHSLTDRLSSRSVPPPPRRLVVLFISLADLHLSPALTLALTE